MRGWGWMMGVLLTQSLAAHADETVGAVAPTVTQTRHGEWWVIDASPFQIVYPAAAAAQAQRMATALRHYELDVRGGYDTAVPPIPVVLWGQTPMVNGYVQQTPWESAFFSVPPTTRTHALTFHGLGWIDVLSIHEQRHMVQLTHARRGTTRLLYVLFGPGAGTLSTFFSVPSWVLEGDATLAETQLSQAGRGRVRSFDLPLRAALAERPDLTIEHLTGTSYTRAMPSWYVYGYFLTRAAEADFGAAASAEVVARAAAWSFIPFAYSHQMGRVYGTRLPAYTKQTLATLQATWAAERAALTPTPDAPLPQTLPNPRRFSTWTSPQVQPDGSVIARRSALGEVHTLERLAPDGTRERLATVEAGLYVSAAGGVACWERMIPDLRWPTAGRSELRCLDLDDPQRRWSLGTDGRYFHPAVSPRGDQVAAIQIPPDGAPTLVLFDTRSGDRLWERAFAAGDGLSDLSWSDRGTLLVLHTRMEGGDRLIELSPEDEGAETVHIDWTWSVLRCPQRVGDTLYYNAQRGGLDAIWARDLETGAERRVVSRPFGALRFQVAGDTLVYEDYAPRGISLHRADPGGGAAVVGAAPLSEAGPPLPIDFHGEWDPEPYGRYRHAPRAVGWGLSADHGLGVRYAARELLGSYEVSADVGVQAAPTVPGASVRLAWHDLPVILDVSADTRLETALVTAEGQPAPPVTLADPTARADSEPVTWSEVAYGVGATLPLDLSRGSWVRQVSLTGGVAQRRFSDLSRPVSAQVLYGEGQRIEVQAGLTAANLQPVTGIAPRWGQTLSLRMVQTPLGGDQQGTLVGGEALLFFPGLGINHSLQVRAGGQHRAEGSYPLRNVVTTPAIQSVRPDGWLATGRADYRLALAHPEARLLPGLFLSRVVGGPFVEVMRGEQVEDFTWAGVRLAVDCSLMRLASGTFSLGLDIGYVREQQTFGAAPIAEVGL